MSHVPLLAQKPKAMQSSISSHPPDLQPLFLNAFPGILNSICQAGFLLANYGHFPCEGHISADGLLEVLSYFFIQGNNILSQTGS